MFLFTRKKKSEILSQLRVFEVKSVMVNALHTQFWLSLTKGQNLMKS